MSRTLLCTTVVLFTCLAGFASAAEGPVPDYTKEVAPILRKYCAGCHNDSDREAEFSLESFASLQKGTDDGPALLPGDTANSKMMRLIAGVAEPKMPPEGEPAPSAEEIAILKAWIDGGAKGPAGEEPDRLMLIVPHIEPQTDRRPIASVDVAPGGTSIAIARYGTVEVQRELRVTNPETGKKSRQWQTVLTLDQFPGKVASVHYHGGAKLVTASGVTGLGGVAAIWEWPLKRKLKEFKGHSDIMLDAELSPDGQVLATCSYDRLIILWDAATGEQLRTLEGHTGAVFDVGFSPEGEYLVSASADDTCKVWRVSDGERLDTLGQPLKEQYAVAFSPDGENIVAGGADNRIRVWKFISKDKPRINPLLHARFAHEGPIVALGFTPDGSRLVSVAEDKTIKAWDTASYEEIQLIENEPEVAMALAVYGEDEFLVGRLDGSLQHFKIKPSVSRQVDRGVVRAPVPVEMPDEMNTNTEQEPNDRPDQATSVKAPARVTGVIEGIHEGMPDRDQFRFSARAGEEWVIEVNAARSKSPLDSFVEVLDARGEPIVRVQLQAVRDSYFTFRGKNGDQSNDFRLFNWEEMELNEYLYANGEVARLWLYPRGPDSGFNVYPGSGNRWGYFDTTPLSHPLGEPCYIVEPHPPGVELVPNGLPVFTVYYENDDESRRKLGADSKLYFTAPADGDYIVRLRDVRGQQGKDYTYTLTLRPRQPDFKVTVHDRSPTVNPGSGKEFKVSVDRIDHFDGPIRVDIEGVPPGFSVTTPLIIQQGQIEAYGVVTAASDAIAPSADVAKAVKITATAEIREQEVSHEIGDLGEIKLGEKPQLTATILPAEGGAVPVNSSDDPQSRLSAGERNSFRGAESDNGPLEFVIEPGQTIMLKVTVERNGHKGLVKFGEEDSGRNLPHGIIVDNIGLNGLMLLEDQNEREFFLTAAKWVPEQTRTFHLRTNEAGQQATRPVILHVRRPEGRVAGGE